LYYKPSTFDSMEVPQNIKEEIKNEIMKELRARQRYVQMYEIYQEGNPEQMNTYMQSSERIFNTGPGTPGNVVDDPNIKILPEKDSASARQGYEILYGFGTVALMGMLLPHFRQKVQSVFTRTASEGMDLFEKANSLVARAKEDIEDLIAEASFISKG
jgi:hypothetical protein